MKFLRLEPRSFLLSLLVFLFTACGDGGCSGCEACGVAPIPGGYPIDERIENSAQVRLTSSGVDFIDENIVDIVGTFVPEGLDFRVSREEERTDFGTVIICTDDDCVAHIEIPEPMDIDGADPFILTAAEPSSLRAHIRLVVDSRNVAGMRDSWTVDPPGPECELDIDTRRGSRNYVGLVADISLVSETQPARAGYTKIVVNSIDVADGEGVENDDLDIDGPFFSLCTPADWNFAKDYLIRRLSERISSLVDRINEDQLCTKRGEYGCPTGTFARPDASDPASICRYEDNDDAECVSQLLGSDGQGDLGAAFLGSFSPGTHAPGQFLLAAGGDGEAVNDGMSVFFYGGFRGTDRSFMNSPAHNPCVPLVDPPALPTVPRAEVFRNNTIPGGGDAHVGIGLSEQYLNHTGYGLFDSGMLCIGAGTRFSQQISTGLFSLLIPSIKDIAFPLQAAPLAFAIRPQAPPVFEVGAGTTDDPLVLITLPNVEMDFYVWSSERYVRFLTYSATLEIPVNLSVVDGAIVPQIESVDARDSSVTNSELLQETPAMLAEVIETVISMFAGMATGGIDPVELPAVMGFELNVPENGILGVEDGGDEFLSIFANLALAPAGGMYTATAETTARLGEVHVDPTPLQLETFGQGEAPWAQLELSADGPSGVDYEYSWRVDGMAWSAWSSDRFPTVRSEAFLLQARHQLEVRARIAGAPGSQDPTPARIEVLIDALSPDVTAERVDEGVRVTAFDVLSASDDLQYRYKKNGGSWSDWAPLGAEAFVPVGYDDSQVDVEVQDEAGNVGAARAPLIRGLPNASGSGGCECSVQGQGGPTPFGALGILAVVGLLLRRRRGQRRPPSTPRGPRPRSGRFLHLALLIVLPVAMGIEGCSCGDDAVPERCGGMCADPDPTAMAGTLCCDAMDMCVSYDRDALCDDGFECPVDNLALDEACGVSCSECAAKPGLEPGLLATYLDMVVTGDGDIVFSGYAPGVPPMRQYGDLVVGRYDEGSMSTEWEIVDGAPTSPITNDPGGWRGGVSASGDDVGRWTSIAEADGTFYVAYYDVGNRALKMAVGSAGSWAIHTVDEEGDSGRYASLLLDGSGNPVVSYLRMARSAAEGSNEVTSSVVVASASSPSPAGPTDWTIAEVSVGPMACRGYLCADGEACLEDGRCVVPTSDCADECGSDQACFMGACAAELPDPYVEDMPPANGLYTAIGRTSAGLALVWYDRRAGNILGAAFDGSTWGEPFLIDGYGVGDAGVGDSGLGATLFVDASDVWHVAYVDGAEEAVRYARVEAGIPTTELVDDGSTDGTMRHPDGRHIVGDDASIAVTEGGQLRIVYQDATSQRVMLATREAADTEWAISILDSTDHTGWWIEQQLVGTTSHVATWWRNQSSGESDNGVRVLAVE